MWYKLVRQLESKDLLPVVVFSFSKKRCEDCAQALWESAHQDCTFQ